MRLGGIYVDIKGKTDQLKKDLSGAKSMSQSAGTYMQSRFDAINFRKAGLAVAAFGGMVTLAMSKAIKAANEQEAAEKRLAAVIKSTGQTAGFSAQQMYDMASGLQKVTTVGDETIIAGQAILATFKQVRGEAFVRTTKAALDMSEVMQQDLNSTIIQLGKALNDPVANLGALSRAGVQFAKDQKETIKTMWELGNTAGAQDIILKELESQFGGAAEAARDQFGGATKAAKNALGDLWEEIGFTITKSKEFTGVMGGVEQAFVDASGWVKAHREDMAAIAESALDYVRTNLPKALSATKNSVEGVVSVYRALPDEVVGAAGAGIIGRILFGSTPIGRFLTGLLMINQAMAKLPEMFSGYDISWQRAAKDYRDAAAYFGQAMDLLGNKIKGLEYHPIDMTTEGAARFRTPDNFSDETINQVDSTTDAVKNNTAAINANVAAWRGLSIKSEGMPWEDALAMDTMMNDPKISGAMAMPRAGADNWQKFGDTGAKSWKQIKLEAGAATESMSWDMEKFYADQRKAQKKWRDDYKKSAKAGDSFVDGFKAGIMDLQDEMDTLGQVGADMARMIRREMTDAVDDMVDSFISGTDMMTAVASATENMIVNSLGNYSKKMYDKAIDALIDLIAVNIGLGAAESGSYAAGWGGVWAAMKDIGIYAGTATGAMLAAKEAGQSFKAEGGWVAAHPMGGWINQGSGSKDDVFLGATGNVRHWGMGGEYVVNKNAAQEYAPLLEAINRNYAGGGPIMAWEPVADTLAIGGGASFGHGFYKGGGPLSGLAEMALFFAEAVPTMFLTKLIGDKLHASGGWIDVPHGWFSDVFDPGGVVSDVTGGLRDALVSITPGGLQSLIPRDPLEQAKLMSDPEYAKKMLLDLIRGPLEQTAKDLVTPGVFYSDPLDIISDILSNSKEVFEGLTGIEIPSFRSGTDYVPRTGLAYVHQGEKITPAAGNKSGPVTVNLNVDGRQFGQVVIDQARTNPDMVQMLREVL